MSNESDHFLVWLNTLNCRSMVAILKQAYVQTATIEIAKTIFQENVTDGADKLGLDIF